MKETRQRQSKEKTRGETKTRRDEYKRKTRQDKTEKTSQAKTKGKLIEDKLGFGGFEFWDIMWSSSCIYCRTPIKIIVRRLVRDTPEPSLSKPH